MADLLAVKVSLDDPPVQPPDGCPNPALWRLAREKFEAHGPNASGGCSTCPTWRRCSGLLLARDGLATAMGQNVKESPYWRAFAELMRSPKHSAALRRVDEL